MKWPQNITKPWQKKLAVIAAGIAAFVLAWILTGRQRAKAAEELERMMSIWTVRNDYRHFRELAVADIATLKEKALDASSGAWAFFPEQNSLGNDLPPYAICITARSQDAEYIAAASPHVILGLIEENEHLKRCLAIQSAINEGMKLPDSISMRLRRERFNRRITCRMLATELGLAPSRISEIENGIGERTKEEEEIILKWLGNI